MGAEPVFVPLSGFQEYPEEIMVRRATDFYADMARRRTVPHAVIENFLRGASTASGGANMQPWKFVVVSDPDLKKIREKAEEEEREFYARRATPEWLAALEPLGTDELKPYLETVPYLISIFVERFGRLSEGEGPLRDRVGRNCDRDAHHCHPPRRSGKLDPCTEPNGISQ